MHHLKKTFLILALAAFVLPALPACGDDEGASSTPAKKPKRRSASAAPAAVAVEQPAYPKVDEELRHEFKDSDFIPDSSGKQNRDPFYSWVLRPIAEPKDEGETIAVKKVDVCTNGRVRWGAENHSVRDLNLIGLVKRGRSYAQFTDGAETDSWVVRKGDCIGQEKAIVEEIGVGYVRLKITPKAPAGAPAPRSQTKDIVLYPEGLSLSDSVNTSSFE